MGPRGPRYVLGVDGGNTKTIALVAALSGEIAGRGRAGSGDIYASLHEGAEASAEAALGAIERAAHAAIADAEGAPDDLAATVLSLAGADWPEDFALLRAEAVRRGLGRRVGVVNDALGALRAGSAEGWGVAVACGTGAATGARSRAGTVWHASFWQEAGGAWRLSEETLRLVYRSELRIDPPTALTALVPPLLGAGSVEELLHMLTRRAGRVEVDGLARGRLVRGLLGAAEEGDAPARAVVLAHGAELGDYALVAARKVGILGQPFPLVLAGGVLRHPCRLLADALVARVRERAPDCLPRLSGLEPAVGAVLLGLQAAGIAIDDALLARLRGSLPEASLFET